jgi:CRP-like cAMP-binding protein
LTDPQALSQPEPATGANPCTALAHKACASCTWHGNPICPVSEVQLAEFAGCPTNAPLRRFALAPSSRPRFGLLQSGLLMRRGPKGQGLDLVFPGESILEPFHDAEPHPITAVLPSRLCWFDMATVEARMQDKPGFLTALMRGKIEELNRAHRFIWIRSALTIDQRMAALMVLLFQHEDEGSHPPGQPSRLRIDWSRRDVASLIGTTLESISRATHRLEDLGLIRILDPDCFDLCDLEGLTDLAEFQDLARPPQRPAANKTGANPLPQA